MKLKNSLFYLNWQLRYRKLYIRDKFIAPDYEHSQYFFTGECVDYLVDKLDCFNNPCCIGTPRLAKGWFDRGRKVRLLDIDKRFSFLPGYKYYDITKPEVLNEKFDVIIMDPTFKWGDGVLLKTINAISHHDHSQKVLLIYLSSRGTSILQTFKDYNLKPTGYYPKYSNVRGKGKKIVMCYSNFQFP
jgi:hypothetical protein